MKLSVQQKAYLVFVILFLLVCSTLWWVRHTAQKTIQDIQIEAESTGRVDVSSQPLAPLRMDGITFWLQAAETRALTSFQGKFYAATVGGLLCLDESGKVIKHYTMADGLPELDLTALSVFQEKLFIGTRTAGLLSFDGKTFTQHSFRSPRARQVRALCPTPSYLLIGTFDGGLFDFDGATFAHRFQPIKGPKIEAVTAVLAVESRIYLGTQNSGLFVWREGELRNFTTADGLPSPRVTALLASGTTILIATDAGTVRLVENGPFEQLSNQPNLTSLVEFQGKVWGGLVTGGVVEVPKTGGPGPSSASKLFGRTAQSETGHPLQTVLTTQQNTLWALTEKGIFKLNLRPGGGFEWEAWGTGISNTRQLAASHVNSLAFDEQGRLWVGYFDRGLDVLNPATGEREQHFQDEAIREINCLRYSAETREMLVATSGGLTVYDSALRSKHYDEKSASLIGNNVAYATRLPGYALFKSDSGSGATRSDAPIVLATARGLTLMQAGVSRSLNAFHGLASNYLYCAEPMAGKLYLGSLGGLMELDGLRVIRTWKIDNSRLTANWITSLIAVNGTLYVGTYGGGVNALLPTGEIVRFEETAGIEVNNHAMATDGDWLYVGTLDKGLLMYDLNHRIWRTWSVGLASSNVTSLVIHDGALFLGTTGGVIRIEMSRLKE